MSTFKLPPVPSFKTPRTSKARYKPIVHKTTAFGLASDIKPIGERAPTHHSATSGIFHPSLGSITGHASLGYTKTQLGTSSTGGFSKHSSPFKAASTSQATLLQQLGRQYVKQQPHSSGSLFDQIKSGAGTVLSKALDYSERPLYAVASGVDAAASGHSILHGAEKGFTGANKETFGEVLKKHHILSGHSILRGAAGLGLDFALDPLNALVLGGSVAAAPETGGASLLADGALAAKLLDEGGHAAEAGAMVKKVLTDAPDLRKQFEAASKEAGLGTKSLNDMTNQELGRVLNASTNQHILADIQGKALESLPKTLSAKIRPVPFTSKFDLKIPETAFGKRIMPMLPSLKRTAEGRGVIAHLPLAGGVAKHVADTLGSVFKHSFKSGVFDTLAVRHSAASLARHQFGLATKELEPFAKHLSNDEQLAALHVAEQSGSVVKHGDQYVVDEKFLKDHGLNSDQIGFVKAWHGVMERQRIIEKEAGLHYGSLPRGEEGRVYVPHGYRRDGTLMPAATKAAYRASFQHEAIPHATLQRAAELNRIGHLPHESNIETNVMQIVSHRIGSSAVQQARASFQHVVKHLVGVDSHIVDHAQIAKDEEAVVAIKGQLARHKLFHNRLLNGAKGNVARDARLRTLERRIAKAKSDVRRWEKKHAAQVDTKGATTRSAAELEKAKGKLANLTAEQAQLRSEAKAFNDVKVLQSSQKLKGLEADAKKAEEKFGSTPMKKNPDIPEGFVAAPGTLDVLKDTHVPQEVKDVLDRVEVLSQHPEALAGVLHAYERVLNSWKVGVTAANPGYGIKNSMSDIWNMFVSGMPLSLIPVYAAKAAKLMRAASKGDAKAEELIREAESHGVISGLFQGDITNRFTRDVGGKLRHPLRTYTRGMMKANVARENNGRLAHYLWRLDHEKDPILAAREVRRAHFDYEELTPAERKIKQSLIPFYTWTRKNVPYQLTQMISRPGRYASYTTLGQESELAAGNHKGELIPSYLTEGAFKIPTLMGQSNYFNAPFGPADIAKLLDIKQNAASFLGPGEQIPMALLTGVDPSTGLPIQSGSHSRTPINGHLAALLDAIPGLSSLANIGPTSRQPTGRGTKYSSGVSPWLSLLLGEAPALNAIARDNPISNVSEPRDLRALDYLTGASVYNVNPKVQSYEQQIAIQQAIQQYIAQLRENRTPGVPRASKQHIGKYDKATYRIAKKKQGRA